MIPMITYRIESFWNWYSNVAKIAMKLDVISDRVIYIHTLDSLLWKGRFIIYTRSTHSERFKHSCMYTQKHDDKDELCCRIFKALTWSYGELENKTVEEKRSYSLRGHIKWAPSSINPNNPSTIVKYIKSFNGCTWSSFVCQMIKKIIDATKLPMKPRAKNQKSSSKALFSCHPPAPLVILLHISSKKR